MSNEAQAGLQVLGVGLPRTGTASLKAALEILGYRCHHMFEVVRSAEQGYEWKRIYREAMAGNRSPGFSKAFQGYTAAVDCPSETLWPLILEEYPKVKIILTSRPADAWLKSVNSTIMLVGRDPVYPFLIFWVNRLWQQLRLARDYVIPLWEVKYGGVDEGMMEQRVQEVKNSGLGPEQLLDFDLSTGWEPLCKFLDKPIPSQAFPRENDKEAFGAFMQKQINKGLLRWAIVIACGGVGVGLCIKHLK